MGYAKVISYGNIVEMYRYERNCVATGRKRAHASTLVLPYIPKDGESITTQSEQKKVRTKSNARSATLAFRRLVGANLGGVDNPVLASFTYRENMEELTQGRKDFNAFAKLAKNTFGAQFRYICVAEFQRRGAVHFHALLWGVPASVVAGERVTRMVAALWGRGFVDLVSTDGNIRLATYLSKYMSKMFIDSRLANRKAYIASRNILRPKIDRDALLAPYFHGGLAEYPDLSTATVLRESEYNTQWLGRCDYKQYNV